MKAPPFQGVQRGDICLSVGLGLMLSKMVWLGRFCTDPKSHKVLCEALATAMFARVCEENGLSRDGFKENINQVTGQGASRIDPQKGFPASPSMAGVKSFLYVQLEASPPVCGSTVLGMLACGYQPKKKLTFVTVLSDES